MATLGLLNFCEVDNDDLKIGEKYMIQERSYQHTRTIYGVFAEYITQHITEWSKNMYTIESSYMQTETYYASNIRLNIITKKCEFYKLISSKEQIQQDMENRAINLILQKLIGDDAFNYEC